MKTNITHKRILCLMLVLALMPFAFYACSSGDGNGTDAEKDTSEYIVSIWDQPDSVDFQCTTLYYNTAYCAFDRLLKMERGRNDNSEIKPSLAESWDVSEDGRSYTFHLRKGVKFSNGSPLTSSDVRYTLTRLLTHPDSTNRDIAECILGAEALETGSADTLEGFSEIDDLNFTITLEEPFEAFLACLTMPGASIMDEETTVQAGDDFGKTVESMIGTGSFILRKWEKGKGMLFEANPDCWAGAPECKGIDVRFMQDSEEIRALFDKGKLDIMDLNDLDGSSEYYIHGDIYKKRLYEAQQVGINYIALNESIKPLDDVRVRKALQLGLNRKMILDAVYSGRGEVENGIFPHGLYGFNEKLKTIPYDAEKAKALLGEAGYPDGFDLTFTVRTTSSQSEMDMINLIADMWKEIGVNTNIEVIDESEFMSLRKAGRIACYQATWIADYNDPDNFIYTFFGNKANTVSRSLCYPDEDIMKRVRNARTILNSEDRILEYRELEKRIVQEDCAWVPLLSRTEYYMTSDRLNGFRVAWTGRYFPNYREMSVRVSK